MKLTDNTLAILKNFAAINSSVVLNAGRTQKTISADKAVLVEAQLDDDIPNNFGIYDLNQFLGNVTTLNNPDLTFTDDDVTLNDGEFALTYRACPSHIIPPPPKGELVLKSVDVSFLFNNAILQKMIKVATMNNFPNLTVLGKNGELRLEIHEKASDTSNYGSMKIGEYAGDDFNATFKIDNFKLIPDDYTVEIQKGAFAKFVNSSKTLTYFIALETK